MEFKFLITITRVDDGDQPSEPNFRNVRNKTILKSLVSTRYTTIKRRIKMNKAYQKLPLCTKEEFYNWSINNNDLIKIFEAWNNANHQHRLMPTVDRIDPKKGYTIDNIRWLALYENCGKARQKK
jgi:hypothetical protein